jgi:hypothetical protein
MIYETRKYIDILTKFKITPTQFLFAWMVYNKQWEELRDYMNTFGAFDPDSIQDLIDKDLILNINPSSKKFGARDLQVTEVFAGEMVVTGDDAWEEFYERYPGMMVVNGTRIATKGLTRQDEEYTKAKYIEYVNTNKYVHQNILAMVSKYKEDNGGLATMKIDKFVSGQFWNEIEKGRDNYVGPALF